MTTLFPVSDSSRLRSTDIIGPIVLLLTLLYGMAHLVWYWQTPFGTAPVLDERENLHWAALIGIGDLPHAPFFRAMGYPLVLAGLSRLPIAPADLPLAATLLGLALHLINTLLVLRIASALFRNRAATLLAGLAHGLNPVLLHFATQILDNTLANTGLLIGLLALVHHTRENPPLATYKLAAIAAVAWTFSALVRPQLLVLLPVLPPLWFAARPSTLRDYGRQLAVILLSAGALLIAQGLWQKSVCGSFHLLPGQTAYNLWAANRPGADGRYFTQVLRITATDEHANPAGIEARVLYTRETGHPPTSAQDVDRYWQGKLYAHIVHEPLEWLCLVGRKTYYLFNDFEAYNNKTYAFHKARSPWLAPNPIGWGLLLTASVVGTAVLLHLNPRGALVLLATFAVLAIGILLTYVSGRFRLPLTALLCLLAAGLPLVGRLSLRMRLTLTGLVVAIGALTFSDFAGARDTKTFLQDNLLMAGSALTSGDDELAWQASATVLAQSPAHPDARAYRLSAGFNLLVAGQLDASRETLWRQTAADLIADLGTTPQIPQIVAIAGLARWRDGDRDGADALWREQSTHPDGLPSACAFQLAHPEATLPALANVDTGGAFELMLKARESPTTANQSLRQLTERLFFPPHD